MRNVTGIVSEIRIFWKQKTATKHSLVLLVAVCNKTVPVQQVRYVKFTRVIILNVRDLDAVSSLVEN